MSGTRQDDRRGLWDAISSKIFELDELLKKMPTGTARGGAIRSLDKIHTTVRRDLTGPAR